MADIPQDPVGGATNISFLSVPAQCEDASISWQGGQPPVRLEFYQQNDTESDWDIVPFGMFNVDYQHDEAPDVLAARTTTFDWSPCNVAAEKRLWVVIVDHSGAYSQNREPFIVESSDDAGCLTKAVQIDPSPPLLPLSALILLSFTIFFLGIAVYYFFAWRKVAQLLERKQRSRATIDDNASMFAPSVDATPYEPYMIQRSQSAQFTEDRNGQSSATLPSSGAENQAWLLQHNANGSANMYRTGSSEPNSPSNPFDDSEASSPADTVTSRIPLISAPPAAVARASTLYEADGASQLSRRPSEAYSINSEQSSNPYASRRALSILTAATKASSNETEIDNQSNLSRQTSVTESEGSIAAQFFPIRINQNQNGTWTSSGSGQTLRNPFG